MTAELILLKLTLTLVAAYLALSVARQVAGGLPDALSRFGGQQTERLEGRDATSFYMLATGAFGVGALLIWGT